MFNEDLYVRNNPFLTAKGSCKPNQYWLFVVVDNGTYVSCITPKVYWSKCTLCCSTHSIRRFGTMFFFIKIISLKCDSIEYVVIKCFFLLNLLGHLINESCFWTVKFRILSKVSSVAKRWYIRFRCFKFFIFYGIFPF